VQTRKQSKHWMRHFSIALRYLDTSTRHCQRIRGEYKHLASGTRVRTRPSGDVQEVDLALQPSGTQSQPPGPDWTLACKRGEDGKDTA